MWALRPEPAGPTLKRAVPAWCGNGPDRPPTCCLGGDAIRISSGSLKTLIAIMVLESQGLPVTCAALGRLRGVWKNVIRVNLERLERAGLVRREPGKANTIRSTCRWVPT